MRGKINVGTPGHCDWGTKVSNIEMSYDGVKGSVEYNEADGCWHGQILGTDDLVTYEAGNEAGLMESFIMAVDDWRETRNNFPT